MSARDAIAADAVIAEMRGVSWTQAFTPERFYVRSQDKVDTKRMQVQVQANGTLEARITRKHRRLTHSLLVTVLKSVDPKNTAAVDSLSALAEEIGDYFRTPKGQHRIAGTQSHVSDVIVGKPDPGKLETDLQFFAAVSLAVTELVVDV